MGLTTVEPAFVTLDHRATAEGWSNSLILDGSITCRRTGQRRNKHRQRVFLNKSHASVDPTMAGCLVEQKVAVEMHYKIRLGCLQARNPAKQRHAPMITHL